MVGRPASFAGLALDRPRLMGVVNVTPDSFHDGGRHFDPERAIAHGRALARAGADLLDIGGESTRPGAQPVSAEDERARVLPIIRALKPLGVPLSIDSRRPLVMEAALAAGAMLVNDVTALADPLARRLVAESGAFAILMHMQGEPATMQAKPTYGDVVAEVRDFLAARLAQCAADGIARERLAIDPGIGFGKTLDHNLALIAHLDRLADLGVPVVLGVSRKSFIAHLMGGDPPTAARLPGSLAAALAGLERGASILRVHDVAETAQAVAMWRAIGRA
ncbi:MAG: dihydropteroate synthase [Rhodospirillales bacterium]|nr:dihydropteroate synthase [Rhodospirillales bacterium]